MAEDEDKKDEEKLDSTLRASATGLVPRGNRYATLRSRGRGSTWVQRGPPLPPVKKSDRMELVGGAQEITMSFVQSGETLKVRINNPFCKKLFG